MQFSVVSSVESVDEPGTMNTVENACGVNDMSTINDPGADWEIPTIDPVRTRTMELVSGADGGGLPWDHLSGAEPWGVKMNGQHGYHADMRRATNLPRPGDTEHWTMLTGAGWGHPLHLHFEEAKTISRTTGLHPTEANKRKDVWHIGNTLGRLTKTNSRITFQCTFGEFGGAYVNHCHNTVHEDSAMLLRYDLIKGNSNAGIQDVHITVLPTPNPRPEGVTYVDSCYMAEGNPQKFNTGVKPCAAPDIGDVVLSKDPRTL
jgi:FtsP/CotA-like multicopper oxidase with cupredoxin domain